MSIHWTKNYIPKQDVAKHNTPESCWLIVTGVIYDVTEFLEDHPAGKDAILRHAGQDATRDFNFHSRNAKKLWDKYRIGVTEGYKSCTIL